MNVTGWVRMVVALPLLVAGVVLVSGSPASASCLPDPLPSPYAFIGTVVSTDSGGRIAQVRTDDGRDVEVRGGPGPVATSVDRSYRTGVRYEFHPFNGESPYEDNACTATRELSGPEYPPALEVWEVARLWLVPLPHGD
jgi:hypothetical protein